jgi:hypothetical protein
MHGIALDFAEFSGHHSGLEIARKVKDVVNEFGLHGRILGIVVDNAKANDVAIQDIAAILGLDNTTYPTPSELHFRCFGHMMNLGCKGKCL